MKRRFGGNWKRWRDDRGSVLVLVGLMLGVLLGLAALVTDVGTLYWNRRMLQNAVDGAALAGARELPYDQTAAEARAREYALANGVPAGEIEAITFTCRFQSGTFCPDSITVRSRRGLPPILRGAIGLGNIDVVTEATALTAALKPANLAPWGVPFSELSDPTVDLKIGAPGGLGGNFFALDFPGSSGANSYSDYIIDSYKGDVIGANDPDGEIDWSNPWLVASETGNMPQKTIQPVQDLIDADPTGSCTTDVSCPRVVIVPVLSGTWMDANGKTYVDIVRFAPFFIDGFGCTEPLVNCPPGKTTVQGHWIDYFVTGVGRGEYGVPLDYYGIRGVFLWS